MTSKYKIILTKDYTPNWSEEVFLIKKVKNTVPSTYIIENVNGEEIAGTFYKKELQKRNRKKFRVVKLVNRKGDKLYVINYMINYICLTLALIKKISLYKTSYFPKPYTRSKKK